MQFPPANIVPKQRVCCEQKSEAPVSFDKQWLHKMTGVRFYTDSVSDVGGVGTPIYLHGRIDRKRSDFDYIFPSRLFQVHSAGVCDGRGLPNDDPMVIATIPGWHIVSARWLNEDGKEFKDDWFSCVLFLMICRQWPSQT